MTEHSAKDGEKMNKKMLWMVITLVAIAVVTVPVAACESGGCWLTAGGHITNLKGVVADFKGSYGGNGMTMKGGSVRGEWNHVDHLTGAHFHGDVTWLKCDHQPYPGPDVPKAYPNHVWFGGVGTLDGVDGCEFSVDAYDINEGGIHRDGYKIDVECYDDGSELHNQATSDQCNPLTSNNPIGCLAGGNIQIHPPNNGHP
jgi:hypothetical protein